MNLHSNLVQDAPSPSARVVRRLFYEGMPLPLAAQPNATIVALSRAPFQSNHTLNTSFLISAEEFFEDNPLISATLHLRTQHRYAVALEKFRASSFASFPEALPLDHRLCMYIQDCFTQNPRPGKRQEMANLVCMLLVMYPALRGANLGLSRRCLSGWRALKPAKSSAPFTKDIILALAWRFVSLGRPESAVVVLTTFFACLRVSEALALRMEVIAYPGDARLAPYGPNVAGMNIRDAKTARHTGTLQFVKLEDRCTIKFLRAWQASANRQTGRLVHLTYQAYAAHLKEGLNYLGISRAPFTSNSARIGKAKSDYVIGIPVSQIAINGRWKFINSLRYYVNNGRAWFLNSKIPPSSQQVIRRAADRMTRLIDSFPTSEIPNTPYGPSSQPAK